VRGYVEVLRHYREISGIRQALATRCCASGRPGSSASTRPTSTSGSKRVCAAGIKTIHFICPSIWAWRGGA
jgi:lipid-A-disaccharide synthase